MANDVSDDCFSHCVELLAMPSTPIPWNHPRLTLFRFAPLWCGIAILFGAMGVGYALLRSKSFSARQPLVVRDEANRSVDRLGRFPGQLELKAALETILERKQNPDVVAEALRHIGSPADASPAGCPSTNLVETTTGSKVNLLAAQGSEFGKTEVVYLHERAENPQRAMSAARLCPKA
jgi:succinoglycan biosynthesis transport protein ExoP